MTHPAPAGELARCGPREAKGNAFRETKRVRVGRDLDDGLRQIMARVAPRLQGYARRVASGQGSPGEHAAEARHIDRMLRKAFSEARELSRLLVPAPGK